MFRNVVSSSIYNSGRPISSRNIAILSGTQYGQNPSDSMLVLVASLLRDGEGLISPQVVVRHAYATDSG
jgi:hypothetical protein